jgi:pyruvate dehydrogenase E1 component alpha subunit
MREQHDPITGARAKLLELGVAEADLKKIEDETKAVIQQAAEFAQTSAEPDAAELWTDILLEA